MRENYTIFKFFFPPTQVKHNPMAGILEQSVQAIETGYPLEDTTQVLANSPSFDIFKSTF